MRRERRRGTERRSREVEMIRKHLQGGGRESEPGKREKSTSLGSPVNQRAEGGGAVNQLAEEEEEEERVWKVEEWNGGSSKRSLHLLAFVFLPLPLTSPSPFHCSISCPSYQNISCANLVCHCSLNCHCLTHTHARAHSRLEPVRQHAGLSLRP